MRKAASYLIFTFSLLLTIRDTNSTQSRCIQSKMVSPLDLKGSAKFENFSTTTDFVTNSDVLVSRSKDGVF